MADCEPGTVKVENGTRYLCVEGSWVPLAPSVDPGRGPKIAVIVDDPAAWDEARDLPQIRAALGEPSLRLRISVEPADPSRPGGEAD